MEPKRKNIVIDAESSSEGQKGKNTVKATTEKKIQGESSEGTTGVRRGERVRATSSRLSDFVTN